MSKTSLESSEDAVTNTRKRNYSAVCQPPSIASDIGSDIGMLLENQEGSVVVFDVGGEKFHAHKLILTARSHVFRTEFSDGLGEDKHEVTITDLQPKVFKAMLHFIYKDTLVEDEELMASSSSCSSVSDTLAGKLLAAADKYGLKRLKLMCEPYVHKDIAVDSVATTFALADCSHATELKENLAAKKSLKDGRNENFVEVISVFQVFLEQELGAGSNGTKVYEGTLNGRNVTVKCLCKEQKEEYDWEVEVLNQSTLHPNVIVKFDAREHGDRLFIVMEKCLEDVGKYKFVFDKKRNGHLLYPQSSIPRDIALGLSHLHACRIVHGDLTPSKVLIVKSYHAKICDMGQSCIVGDDASFISASGIGTKGWRAPELKEKADKITFAADAFCLGLVLYSCYTNGGHPFKKNCENIEDEVLDDRIKDAGRYLLKLEELQNLELRHLLSKLLVHARFQRPAVSNVTAHPLFWPPLRRIQFLHDCYKETKMLGTPGHIRTTRFIKRLEKAIVIADSDPWYYVFPKDLLAVILAPEKHRTS